MKYIINGILAFIASILFIAAFILLLYAAMYVFDGSPTCFINIPVALVCLFISWLIYRRLDNEA